jgi:tetratricopeptide (TPR) repeat protein
MSSRFSYLMFALIVVFLMARSSSVAAQESQDNQPHVEPRSGTSTPPAKPKQQPSPQPPSSQPPSSQPPQQLQPGQQPQPGQQYQPGEASAAQGESSSRDSQVDFSGASRPSVPAPSGNEGDEKTFRPWDPHRAAKDIEVGEYYLKLKNYRAALERFNDALLYKPNDAEGTFDLAVTQERMDLFAKARQNYSRYLEILPEGPKAKESQEALKRLESRMEAAPAENDATKKSADDLEAGETYLARNDYDAARERFEEALRLTPENPKACFRLAQSLQGLQRPEPARSYYQKYLDLDPHGPYAADARKAIADINFFVGKQ